MKNPHFDAVALDGSTVGPGADKLDVKPVVALSRVSEVESSR